MIRVLSIVFFLSRISCAQEIFLKELPAISEVKPGITLAWVASPLVDGSLILGGIATGQYCRSWDAGTNQQITITGLPGGFTWYFAAETYDLYYPETNQVRHIKATSGIATEIAQTIPCPPGEPQLLITNGVWIVIAQGGGSLQSSSDFVTWSTLGPAPVTAPMPYAGVVTNRQFFRIHP